MTQSFDEFILFRNETDKVIARNIKDVNEENIYFYCHCLTCHFYCHCWKWKINKLNFILSCENILIIPVETLHENVFIFICGVKYESKTINKCAFWIINVYYWK